MEELFSLCAELLEKGQFTECPSVRVYPASVQFARGGVCFLAQTEEGKHLYASGGELPALFYGALKQESPLPVKQCPLDGENAQVLMELFPFTRPCSHRGHDFTLGLGDRLGLATPGHLQTIRGKGIFPVLAQQSMRELNLLERTYDDVLASAAFGVFQEGWTQGYGADGDHLKTPEEVRYALACGYTMITLDCSQQIDNSIPDRSQKEQEALYAGLSPELREHFESRYLGSFPLEGITVQVDFPALREIVLLYHRALDHAESIYRDVIAPNGREVDLELSIDETLTPTSPAAHLVVGKELLSRGVPLASLAPRFVGEFQKGIDYLGDPAAFERDFAQHAAIAAGLGYRVSVHSGSDKFTIFPAVGKHTGGRVHVKTAGTSWLVALKVVARRDPGLYREMHTYALRHLEEARQYYHISADPAKIRPLDQVEDRDLPSYLDQDDARQVLHITYGALLTARNEFFEPLFRDRFYRCLDRYEEDYDAALRQHIGRHVAALRPEA